jgi:hypothetical protein
MLANLSNHHSFFYVILLYDIGIEWIVARKSAEQNVLRFWLLVLCFDLLIDWLVFNVQRAIFQLYSGREHLTI